MVTKRFFVSHSSEDKEIADAILSVLEKNGLSREEVFFTSGSSKEGIGSGKSWREEIREEIKTCNSFLFIITPAYFRSVISLFEYGMFLAQSEAKEPCLLVFPGTDEKTLLEAFGTLQFIVSDQKNAAGLLADYMTSHLKLHPLSSLEDDLTKVLDKFSACPLKSIRSPIGIHKEFDNLLSGAEKYGVNRLTDRADCPVQELLEKSDHVYFLTTTGKSFFHNFGNTTAANSPIVTFLAKGGILEVAIPNADSDFLRDVDTAEERTSESSKCRLEALDVYSVLNNLLQAANNYQKTNNIQSSLGQITLYCAGTLLRQTYTLYHFQGDKRNYSYGWLTMTLPPARASLKSPNLELLPSDESLLEIAGRNFEAISSRAKRFNQVYNVSLNKKDFSGFFLDGVSLKEFWNRKAEEAQEKTLEASYDEESQLKENVLVEIAAQHPLKNGNTPGKEFAVRLLKGLEIYKTNPEKTYIYVPGSRHKDDTHPEGGEDKISLSQAGIDYLKAKGVKEDHLFGPVENRKYRQDEGVYNSADECAVAAKIFFEGEFGRLICVCSPFQAQRKLLYYVLNGVIPEIVTITAPSYAHQLGDELASSLANLIKSGDDLQDKDNPLAIYMRKRRKVDGNID